MNDHLSRRGKFAPLALFLFVSACAIAQETIPLISNPLLAVVMAEKSHKFLILLFHRNGPEAGDLGALVSTAIMRDPVLARRALLASAAVTDPDSASLAKDMGVSSFPTLLVAAIHEDGPKSADMIPFTAVRVNVDARSLHLAVMLGLCQNKEAAKEPYFDAEMRTACAGYLKGLSSLGNPGSADPSPSFVAPPRARFSPRPVNPMRATLDSLPGLAIGKPGNSLLRSSSIPNAPPPPADISMPRTSIDPEAAHLSGVWKGKALINICGKPSGTADVELTLADDGFWAGIRGDRKQKGRVTGSLTLNGAAQGSFITTYGGARLETDDLATATRALQGGMDGEQSSPYSLRLTAESPYLYLGYYQVLSGILHRANAGCSNWLDRGETLGATLHKQ